MQPAYANEVEVTNPVIDQDGLRVNHPRLKDYMTNGFKLGWGNEQICQVTGLPPSIVSSERSKYEREKRLKK